MVLRESIFFLVGMIYTITVVRLTSGRFKVLKMQPFLKCGSQSFFMRQETKTSCRAYIYYICYVILISQYPQNTVDTSSYLIVLLILNIIKLSTVLFAGMFPFIPDKDRTYFESFLERLGLTTNGTMWNGNDSISSHGSSAKYGQVKLCDSVAVN